MNQPQKEIHRVPLNTVMSPMKGISKGIKFQVAKNIKTGNTSPNNLTKFIMPFSFQNETQQ